MDKFSFLVANTKQNNNPSKKKFLNKQNFRRKERLLQHSLRGFDTKKKALEEEEGKEEEVRSIDRG